MQRALSLALAVFLGVPGAAAGPTPTSSTWTYQGQLEDTGGPVIGQVDMRFTLIGGSPQLPPIVFDGQSGNHPPVTAADGLLRVDLDFGSFDLADSARSLKIEVRSPHDPTDTASYTTLLPYTPVRAAPLALTLRGLRTELGEPNSPVWNVIGGYQENVVTGVGGVVAGGGNQVKANAVTGDYGVVGGGQGNAAGFHGTVGGGIDNLAGGPWGTVAGGANNQATSYGAAVPGGAFNIAGGAWSFAGGYGARVRGPAETGTSFGDEGSFVWSGLDSSSMVSTGPGQFLIDAPGGVGIGTNTPAALLHVGQGDESSLHVGMAPHIALRRDLAADRFRLQIGGNNWGDARLLQIGRDDGGMPVSFTGDIGIGTDDPFVATHLRGKDLNADTLSPGISSNTDMLIESQVANLTLLGEPSGNSDAFIDFCATDLNGTSATRVDHRWRILKRSVNASSGRGDLQLTNSQYNTTSGSLEQVIEHTFADNGKIGFGTLAPLAGLHFVQPDSATTAMLLEGGFDGADPGIVFEEDGGATVGVGLNEANAAALELRTGGSTRMTVTQAGDVGIGTDAPAERLDVAGMIATDGIAFSDGTEMTSAPAMINRLEWVDPDPIVGNGGTDTQIVTIAGVQTGDVVIANAPINMLGVAIANAYAGNGVVAVELVNARSSTVDLSGSNWRFLIIKSQ